MTVVFADTSFYIGLASPRDAAHVVAVDWSRRNSTRIVTTEFVLMEFANAMSRVPLRVRAATSIRAIQLAPSVEIVAADSMLFQEALSLFESRADKGWSLTDCASFIVMQRFGIDEALTTDEHFAQAGFRSLLIA